MHGFDDQFGRFGICKAEDMWSKRPEFAAWLLEVKKVDIEHLASWEEKVRWLGSCIVTVMARRSWSEHSASSCTSGSLGALQDLHGGLQYGDAATPQVLQPGQISCGKASQGREERREGISHPPPLDVHICCGPVSLRVRTFVRTVSAVQGSGDDNVQR
eukprot:scaffold910_cov396-Prasinococcus_capsulatus_cf.AAC.67